MIYATDIGQPTAQAETDKRGFCRRCGKTILHSFAYLAVTAAVFIAVGGAALAALGS